MKITLSQPELEAYLRDQVEAGNFQTPEAVVEDALMRAMAEDAELTDDEWAAIKKSDEQIKRGECVPFDEFSVRMKKKYGIA